MLRRACASWAFHLHPFLDDVGIDNALFEGDMNTTNKSHSDVNMALAGQVGTSLHVANRP